MKKSIGQKLKSSDSLIPLPKNDAPSSYRCVSFSLPEDTDWATSFWGLLSSLTLWFSWERDDLKRGKIVAREWMRIINEARKQWERIGDNACGDDGNNCHDYPLNAPFISFAPQNPFTQPDYIPSGFIAPPFRVIGENDLIGLALGLQVGDVYTYYDRFPVGSLPTIIPPDGFARFRLTYTAPAEIEIHFLQAVGCGIVYMTRDSMLASSEWLSLGKDLISAPPENVVTLIWEYDDTGEGEHYIDVTFLPVVNEVAPFIYYGGGIRKIVICEETGIDMDVRQNPDIPCHLEKSVDGETWEQFADLRLCPPNIRIGEGGIVLIYDPETGEYIPPESDEDFDPRDYPENTPVPDGQCVAAVNAAASIKALYTQVFSAAFFSAVNPTAAAGMIATGVTMLLGVTVTAGLLIPIAVLMLGALTSTLIGRFSRTIERRLRCIISGHLASDGTLAIAAGSYNAVLSEVFTETGTDIAWLGIWYLLQCIGEAGLASALAIGANGEDDCGCFSSCYQFEYTAALGAQGWVTWDNSWGEGTRPMGLLRDGYWEATYYEQSGGKGIYIKLPFSASLRVKEIEISGYFTVGSEIKIWARDGVQLYSTTGSGTQTKTATVDKVTSGIRLNVWHQTNYAAASVNYVRVKWEGDAWLNGLEPNCT